MLNPEGSFVLVTKVASCAYLQNPQANLGTHRGDDARQHGSHMLWQFQIVTFVWPVVCSTTTWLNCYM